jgi:hypothetical protein
MEDTRIYISIETDSHQLVVDGALDLLRALVDLLHKPEREEPPAPEGQREEDEQ